MFLAMSSSMNGTLTCMSRTTVCSQTNSSPNDRRALALVRDRLGRGYAR
jgi:hypothetical protein